MAKHRMINTKFWSDPWVMTKLNSLDRLLFLYLISNELTNISGIYEISEHRIAFDTGIERDTLVKAMIPRLEPKVYFKDNWVILVNFTKHQNLKSEDVIKGIKREFELAPKSVQEEAIHRGWGDGLGIAPDTKPNLTKPLGAVAPVFSYSKESEEEERPKRKPKYPHSKEVFSWFPSPQRNWEINTTELRHAELLWERGEDKVRKNLKYVLSHQDEDYFPKVNKPSDLERKWNDIAYEYGRRK